MLSWNNVVSTLYQRRALTFYQRCATLKIGPRILLHFQCWTNVTSTLIHNIETTLIRHENVGWAGYNLWRADHPSNTKRGGVCIYYKDHLPIIKRNDLCQLHKCLVTELGTGKNKCFFTCLYRSPSQTSEEFEDF